MKQENTKILGGKNSALDFANNLKAGFLATAEIQDNPKSVQPRVRGVLLWYADDSGFYFHTSKTKDLYRQLVANPKVEIAFASQQPVNAMLRIWGDVEFIEDKNIKEKLIGERPWLLSYGDDQNLDLLGVFRIVNAKGKFWQNETNMQERLVPVINF